MNFFRTQKLLSCKNIGGVLATLWLFGPVNVLAVDSSADAPPTLPVIQVETTQADKSQSVSVITRDDTDAMHFINISDALFSGTPGVATSRGSDIGFGGSNSGFMIRGLQGPHVAVFVDGIPIQVNNHFHARVDRYSADMIDRVEVTRGPSVLEHGASGVAGVIDIFTRNPGKGASGFMQASTGRYDTTEVFGDFGYGWDSGSILVSALDRNTDGQDTGGDKGAAAHDNTNINLKLTQAINKEWSIGMRVSHEEEDPDDMDEYENGVTYQRFGQNETDFVVHLDRKTAASNSLIAIYDNTLDNTKANYLNGDKVDGTGSPRKEDETGILARHTWLRSGGNTTTVGFNAVEYSDDRYEGTAEEDETSFYTAYVQASQGFGDNIRIDGGVRVTKGEDFSTDVSPEIGIVYTVDPSLALRARAGEAFRVPRLGDNNELNEPTLDPEEFRHFEMGLNKRFSNGAEFDITAWWMEGDNLIVSVGGWGGFQENSGEFDNSGIEAVLNYPITKHISSYVGYTHSQLETTDPFPEDIFDLGIQYLDDKKRANLSLRNARNNARASLRDDDYTVLDGRFEYMAMKNLALFVSIDNITDTKYITFDRFGDDPNVRRTAMVGFRWTHR
jgi:outer membrane cobalamin receptor